MQRDHQRTSREFLRALRGKRSQLAHSRRLGFRSNVAAEWESGRRSPSAVTVLRACRRLRLDTRGAFAMGSFPAAAIAPSDSQTLAAWLDALRAGHSLAAVAHRSGLSRHQVSRCLSGKTVPKLPQFLALVDACSGRLAEFVSRLVDIEQVPSLLSEYQRTIASRNLIFQHPCASAVLAALDVRSDLTTETAARTLAESLEIDEAELEGALDALERAGVVETKAGTLRLGAPLLVDTASHPDGARRLRQYWADVAAKRTTRPRRGDMFSHNVFSVSRSDLKLIRNLQSEHYQRLRAIINKSPPEVVALLNLQLVEWDVR